MVGTGVRYIEQSGDAQVLEHGLAGGVVLTAQVQVGQDLHRFRLIAAQGEGCRQLDAQVVVFGCTRGQQCLWGRLYRPCIAVTAQWTSTRNVARTRTAQRGRYGRASLRTEVWVLLPERHETA